MIKFYIAFGHFDQATDVLQIEAREQRLPGFYSSNREGINFMRTSRITIKTRMPDGYVHPELHGQFIEHLGNCIDGGIWVGEESDIPNSSGMRKDVVEALAALEPPVMRWPGGCFADTYHWRDGIGPKAERPVNFNANFGTNRLEFNQFGTHEFMDFCRKIHAKPWLNINMLSGSVEEMVSWAEYCNRQHSTSLSRLRAQGGDEAPFDVEYWGIGNEAWAGGGNFTAEGYAEAYRRYASAFPVFPLGDAADTLFPEQLGIKLIAVGPDGNKPVERIEWTTRFLRSLGNFRMPKMDALDLHFYNWNSQYEAGSDTKFNEQEWYRLLDGALELESVILEQFELIQKNLPRVQEDWSGLSVNTALIVGEWGNWHPFRSGKSALWQQNTVRDMLSYALILDIFHRNCDKVKMACLAQTVNVLGALILTDGPCTILTPAYHLFMMYKQHRGAQRIPCQVESELLFSNKSKVMSIHGFASLKGDTVLINIINTDLNQVNEVTIEFDEPVEWVESTVLAADDPHAYNEKENPDRVKPLPGPVPVRCGDHWTLTAAKASVNVIKFSLARAMSQKQQ